MAKNDESTGFGVALSFLILGLFLLLDNDYLGFNYVNNTISVLFIFIGVAGFGIELGKVTDSKGWSEFGIGVGFLVIWSAVYVKFDNVILNWLMFVVLLFACVFLFTGLIKGLKLTNFKTMSLSKILGATVLFITQIATVVGAIVSLKDIL